MRFLFYYPQHVPTFFSVVHRIRTSVSILVTCVILTVIFGVSQDAHAQSQMQRLSQGWPRVLQPILSQLNTQQNSEKSYLALAVVHPTAYLDLRSTEYLRRSLMATPVWNLNDDGVGHVTFGWQCPNSATAWKTGFTSQAGNGNNQFLSLIRKGWGLSTVPMLLTDGYLNDPAENNDEFLQQYINSRSPRMTLLVMEVDSAACDRMLAFLEDYTNENGQHAQAAYKNFGLTLDPNKLEGGACNSLAVASLSKADFFGPVSPYFRRQLGLPQHLMGRRAKYPKEVVPFEFGTSGSSEKKVSFGELYNSDWTYRGLGPVVNITDTEMILLYIRSLVHEALQTQKNLGLSERYFARNLYSANPELTAPTDVQSNRVLINEHFDDMASSVVRLSKERFRELKNANYEVQALKWGTQPALLIQKASN